MTTLLAILLLLAPVYAEDIITADGVRVLHEGVAAAYAGIAARAAERSLETASSLLGHVPAEPVKLIIARDDDHFRLLTGGALPEWSAAVATGDNTIILTPLTGIRHRLEHVVAHEIAHIVLQDAAGETFVPRWFHEGTAELAAGSFGLRDRFYLAWHVVRKKQMSFADIQDVFSRAGADAGLAYDESMLAVRQLIRMHGSNVLRRIVEGLAGDASFPEAFFAATGMWPSEYESRFIGWLGEAYGPGSLYTLVPGTWTLIMLLALFAWVVVRIRTHRKMAEWAAEEDQDNIIDYPEAPDEWY